MMKKVTTAALFAMLASPPAFAWAPIPSIMICNHTDPVLVNEVWLSVGPVFVVNVPGGQHRYFGPAAADPSPRTVVVRIINHFGNAEWFASATPMDLHTENWINVTGSGISGFGGSPIVVTHGRGSCA